MTSWVDQFQTVSSGYTVFLSFQMYVYIVVVLICEYFINFKVSKFYRCFILIRDGNRTETEQNTPNSNPIFGLSEPNRTNPTWSADRTEPNCQAIRTEQNTNFVARDGSVACTVYTVTTVQTSLWCFSQCVLLKHFNCGRPPDHRLRISDFCE